MGDDADICTECAHRREDHGVTIDEPYCHTCLNDVVMDGAWEDDERREGIFHPFGLKELAPTWDDCWHPTWDDCWYPECGVCAERRARREFLSEMLQVMDTGVASFKMIRDLLEDEGHLSFLAQRLASQVEEMREVIKVELDGV